MIENIRNFWYLYLLLLALIAALPFALKAAFRAASRHSREFNSNMEKMKRSKELRDAYSLLTPEIISGAPADSLFEGVAVCLEIKCQKCESTSDFYSSLSEGQRKVYALYYLLTEARDEKLSAFFKRSTRPLTSDAAAAAKELFSSEISAVITQMFDCYDEENEQSSVIPEAVDGLDGEYAALAKAEELFAVAGQYIKENPAFFIEND